MNDLAIKFPLAAPPAGWPQPEALGFGLHLGPYLVCMDHEGSAWTVPQVLERDAARLPIASGALQYGFSVFEGLKAYRAADGRVHLFRPQDHARRLTASARRLSLPEVDEAQFLSSCALAVRVHEPLIPPHGRGSLYLRPTIHAEEEGLGLKRAARHRYTVTVTPCSDPPLKSLRLWAEPEFIRAAAGGLGAAKTGANYAAGIGGLLRARERGYDDVCWLDAATHRLLGEAGTMNLFVQLGDELATPRLDGTILRGVTRDSLLQLARDEGLHVTERDIGLDELADAQAAGRLGGAFGCGTAARVALITEIGNDNVHLRFGTQDLAQRLARRLKAEQEAPQAKFRSWCVDVD